MSSGNNSDGVSSLLGLIRQPLVASLLATLLVMALALIGIFAYAERQSTSEAQRQADRLGNSIQVIMTPLMLADDRVSMNFIANQLVADPVLSGFKLTDPKQLTLAVAGTPSSYVVTRTLAPNGEPLGELTLWVDPVPGFQALKTQLLLCALGFILALLGGITVYRISSSVHPEDTPKPIFADTLREELGGDSSSDTGSFQPEDTDQPISFTEQDIDSDAIPDLSQQPQPDQDRLEPETFEAPEIELNDTDAPISFSEINQEEEDQIVRSNLESWLNDDRDEFYDEQSDTLTVHRALQKPSPGVPTLKAYVSDKHDDSSDVDLIELLRPEPQPDAMPKFKPSPMQTHQDQLDEAPISEEIEISIPVPVQSTPRARKLPIITEEQLDLYTLEHELDLMLPAHDAGYLILIDTTSSHSSNLEPEEAKQIRRTYRTLANSVARIYHGKVLTLGDDLEIRFDDPDEDDDQGINAICAALLFNILYRSYNQSRIKQMAPVLNLHIALVRGQVQRFTQLLDEARFLTRSTQTNHLISHTALTEAPYLKINLLSGAELKREDEDKVLIMKVEKRHQALLEKQARYLLAKLAERASSSQG